MDKQHRFDIAYVKLTAQLATVLRHFYRFIPVHQMLHHNKSLLEANYCLFGYPVINKKQVDGKTKTFGSAYFLGPSQDKVFSCHGLDPLRHYAFEFQRKARNIKTDRPRRSKQNNMGRAGGVWYTDIEFKGNKFRSSVHLIGIMMEFRKGKYECLI